MKFILLFSFLFVNVACDKLAKTNPKNKKEKTVSIQSEDKNSRNERKIKQKELAKKTKARKSTKRKQTHKVAKYCNEIQKRFKKYRWGQSHCENYKWNHVRDSYLGRPLIWKVFGNEKEGSLRSKNVTLILCGVHGDEITPVKFCFDLLKHLSQLDQKSDSDEKLWKNEVVAIAPIVTPDSFFKRRPTRTNHKGVDVNRNFPTKDWAKDAMRIWKHRYRSDPRRYPGEKPLSEHETVFQVNLIKRYKPSKIISVHAPLTIIDYDGPEHGGLFSASKANNLLIQMSKKAKGYRIKNYPFFPGSLGNYAGNERKIPTYTLELPSSDYTKHKRYWKLFKDSVSHAIFEDLSPKTAANP